MSYPLRGLLLGLLTALVGLFASNLPPLAALETEKGLDWLFGLRGPRTAPTEVAVVSVDPESSERLGLSDKPRQWPRDLHARLVRQLNAQGARVIAFDMNFEEAREQKADRRFTEALREAGNVVLFQYLKQQRRALPGGGVAVIDTQVPPAAELAQAAAALAPFPLPKVPVKVSEVWLFKSSAGDAPTLPVAALHQYAKPYIGDLLNLLRTAQPRTALTVERTDNAAAVARQLRRALRTKPALARELMAQVADESSVPDTHARAALAALIDVSSGLDSRHLDFYGPPRSIATLPYYQALDGNVELTDKAVFVGFSAQLQPEQRDGFYTAFSQPDGLDLSGVEIAATTFANLLEGRSVRPLAPAFNALLLGLWGVALGVLFLALPGVWLLPVGLLLAGGYIGVAHQAFSQSGLWLPLIAPLLLQLPVALLGALLWRYLVTRRERERIQDAFGHYLPRPVVDDLVSSDAAMTRAGRPVFGVCLATDAERYTGLAEALPADQLQTLLNRYYQAIFDPVYRHGGFISDVLGDAMLAVWAAAAPDATLRERACRAALAILEVVEAFNRSHSDTPLPTRIGMHCGDMVLGNVGAGEHYEYRAVGDVINAGTRIESLNTRLGTRLLASREVLEGLDTVVSREVGAFRVVGKSRTLTVYEVVCLAEHADARRMECHARFAAGLARFRQQRWQTAARTFRNVLALNSEDGPARYYLELCQRYAAQPASDTWDGVIQLQQK